MTIATETIFEDVTDRQLIRELKWRGFEVREKDAAAIVDMLTSTYDVPAWLTDALSRYLNGEMSIWQCLKWYEATERALQ